MTCNDLSQDNLQRYGPKLLKNKQAAVIAGRYKMIPREERLCNFCHLNEIEDEKHFIFCPLYDQLRADLFTALDETDNTRWQNATNTIARFQCILQPQGKEFALLVCKYLKACFELRKSKMS